MIRPAGAADGTAGFDALAGDLPDDVRAALAERIGANVRLLDGFELREGKVLFDGREPEVRFFDNAG